VRHRERWLGAHRDLHWKPELVSQVVAPLHS
jgi:hypothetical protein